MIAPHLEALWISAAQSGDPEAFSHLVDAHHGRVRSVLRRLCHGNQALADDLAQEAFLKAWQALPSFRKDARFSTWIHRIAYTEFLQHQRKPHQRNSVTTTPVEQRPEAAEDLTLGAPPDTAHLGSLRIDLHHALAKIPVDEANAIIHCFYGDLSHEEAACALNIPLGTLKSQVLRGRERLKALLHAWSPESRAKGNS